MGAGDADVDLAVLMVSTAGEDTAAVADEEELGMAVQMLGRRGGSAGGDVAGERRLCQPSCSAVIGQG